MRTPLVFCIAVLITASLAFAGGGEDKKKGGEGKKKDTNKLEKLAKKRALPPLKGSWSGGPGQGITFTTGDDFKITLKNFIQPTYTSANIEDADDVNDADIRRARTSFSGHVHSPDVKYKLQLDYADSTDNVVKDAWVDFRFLSGDYNLALRGGQQKTGHGREHSASATSLDFVDRAVATRVFTNTRSRGVRLHGAGLEEQLTWYAGIFNTDVAGASTARDEDGSNDDEKPNYHFGAAFSTSPGKGPGDTGDWAPLGDIGITEELVFACGANLQVGNHEEPAAVPGSGDIRVTGINAWGEVKTLGVAILGEFFYREEDPENGLDAESDGFQVAFTYALPAADDSNNQWVFGARVSHVDIEDAQYLLRRGILGSTQWPAGTTGEILDVDFTVGFFDEGHSLKYQAQVTLRNTDPDGVGDFDDTIATVQATVVF
ncbi:MAG: porin [Planctomycetota bacterium]|jgi:hypothetical protein